MIEPVPWIDRKFTLDLPIGVFPAIVERLRGTPARATELVSKSPEDRLAIRPDGKWSVKDHLGHLIDLTRLDERRLDEYLRGVTVLSGADITNQATTEAHYNETPMARILSGLRDGRLALVKRLEILTEGQVASSAVHPRLQQSMRLVDWAYFVAEHDDHHLAHVARLTRLR